MKELLAGIGLSRAQDAAEAGREAAAKAMAALGGEPAALVIVFATPRYDLPVLLAAIRSVTGAARLIGETSSGEMVEGQYMGFGAGLGVLAMSAGPYRFGVASAGHIGNDLDRAGRELARESCSMAGSSPYSALVLMADSLMGDLQQLVQGIYRVTGPKVPLVGGAAADEHKFERTFVFHDDAVIEQGAVALWISGDHPLKVVTRHGFEPIGAPLLVTGSEGAKITEISGRPAAEVYEEQLGIRPGRLSAENFWGTSIYHPFGLLQNDGSMIIRVARSKTPGGALQMQGCVPPSGSAVQVMKGAPDSLLSVVEEVARTALSAHPLPKLLLTFSCAGRAAILGERTPEEARILQASAGDIPVFGVYCCGEFARAAGVLGTHNATLTALAL